MVVLRSKEKKMLTNTPYTELSPASKEIRAASSLFEFAWRACMHDSIENPISARRLAFAARACNCDAVVTEAAFCVECC